MYTGHKNTHLHDELARIGSRHGGALACSKDPHCPDVECSRPKVAPQHDTLAEAREKVCVNHLLRQNPKQNFSAAFLPPPSYAPTYTQGLCWELSQKLDSGPDLTLEVFNLNFPGYSFIPLPTLLFSKFLKPSSSST